MGDVGTVRCGLKVDDGAAGGRGGVEAVGRALDRAGAEGGDWLKLGVVSLGRAIPMVEAVKLPRLPSREPHCWLLTTPH